MTDLKGKESQKGQYAGSGSSNINSCALETQLAELFLVQVPKNNTLFSEILVRFTIFIHSTMYLLFLCHNFPPE